MPNFDDINRTHDHISDLYRHLEVAERTIQRQFTDLRDSLRKLSSSLIDLARGIEDVRIAEEKRIKIEAEGAILRNLIQVKDPEGWLRAAYEADCAERGIPAIYDEEEAAK